METADIWSTIHTERQALADDLGNVSDAQWQTPSLCSRWSVREVLAHMTGTRKRAAGLAFRATDADWSSGEGPEVTGPGISLVLAIHGREAVLADLSGAGVATLRKRMS